MMVLMNENCWLNYAERIESPNYNDRPVEADVSLLVIHNISLPPGQYGGGYVERFFQNKLPINHDPFFEEIKDLRVSSHLLLERTGRVVQFVSFDKRAWHSGISEFSGCDNCNDYSIGIELEGTDDEPYTDVQYEKLAEITRLLQKQYPKITTDRIVGHCDIAPVRKTDPGPAFDWMRYRGLI